MEIIQIPILSDNYTFLLRSDKGEVACVDPGEAEPVRRELHKRGWTLNFIWNTHHHPDHIGANLILQKEFGVRIFGSKSDAKRIPGIQVQLSDGDHFCFGSEEVKVFATNGHTKGHIVYWLPNSKVLFCGDVIFSLGCGKLFEGTPQEMWKSLDLLRNLPEDTVVYTAHEYTQENALFAIKAEPGNAELVSRIAEVNQLRSEEKPTVPTSIGLEKRTNPFLRAESEEIKSRFHVQGKENWEVFRTVREAKDRFDRGDAV